MPPSERLTRAKARSVREEARRIVLSNNPGGSICVGRQKDSKNRRTSSSGDADVDVDSRGVGPPNVNSRALGTQESPVRNSVGLNAFRSKTRSKGADLGDGSSESDSDAIIIPHSHRRRAKSYLPQTQDSQQESSSQATKTIVAESSSDEDVIALSSRRSAKKRKNSHFPIQIEDESSSPSASKRDPERAKARILRKRSTPNAKQLKFELLRRRRQGENVTISDIEEAAESNSDEPRRALYDSGGELAVLSEFPDEESDEAVVIPASNPTRGKCKEQNSSEEYDSDFIDEDDVLEQAEVVLQIPLEFRTASYKSKDWFRLVIVNLLHLALGGNPDQEIFQMAWRKVNDEMGGLVASKYISTKWNPEFVRTLLARPFQQGGERSRDRAVFRNNCEACNMSGHPATYEITFLGGAYDPVSLKGFHSDDDSNADSDEDSDGDADDDIIVEDDGWTDGRQQQQQQQQQQKEEEEEEEEAEEGEEEEADPGPEEEEDEEEDGDEEEEEEIEMEQVKKRDQEEVKSTKNYADKVKDDGEDDRRNYDINWEPIAPDGKTWLLGTTCYNNAESAHRLTHWRHDLKEWVNGSLKSMGLFKSRAVTSRSGWNEEKLTDFIDSLVDNWSSSGVLAGLHKEFKNLQSDARNRCINPRSRIR